MAPQEEAGGREQPPKQREADDCGLGDDVLAEEQKVDLGQRAVGDEQRGVRQCDECEQGGRDDARRRGATLGR